MRFTSRPRFHQLRLPVAALLLLLERTPAMRAVWNTALQTAPARIVSLLKSAFAASASLGAVHSVAGATQFIVSNANVYGTPGTPITPVAFTVTGANVPAGSFRLTGDLPPGVTVPGMNASGVVNGATGTISGTPTAVGTYTVSILAYERANAQGDTYGPTLVSFVITSTASAPPAITTHPQSQIVAPGTTVALTVVATGSPPPTYQWRKNGTLVSGATSATLTLTNVQPADAGSYTAIASNLAGLVSSSPAVLTVNVTGPTLTTQPLSQHLAAGANATLSVAATGTGVSYQWKKDGTAIAGATGASLALSNASAGTMGFYSVTVSSSAGTVESALAIVTVATGGSSRLINVSTRGYVPAGGALTPGFVLQGTASKSLVIRAVGPTLGAFGVGGTLADPVLDVIPLGSSIAAASNDNWGGTSALSTAFSRVGAFALAEPTSNDASVAMSLGAVGASGYTVRITSKNAAVAGIALAEVYDEDPAGSAVRLINVSTSGFVGTGDQALVPGFVIGGAAPKQVLIRAVGPGLEQFGVTGVLANPQLSLVPLGRDFTVTANDNWGGTIALQNAFNQAGAFALPTGSADAAVVLRLPPGGYTVIVSGVGATTGTALVEIYDLDPK
jgi:hypothetical protein